MRPKEIPFLNEKGPSKLMYHPLVSSASMINEGGIARPRFLSVRKSTTS